MSQLQLPDEREQSLCDPNDTVELVEPAPAPPPLDPLLSVDEQRDRIRAFHESIEWRSDRQPPGMGGRGPFVKKPTGDFWACCGESRCLISPSAPCSWLCVSTLILLPVVFFCVGVVPDDEVWSKVVAALLCALCFAMLFIGGCTDPGIILPRRVDEPVPDEVRYAVPGATHSLSLEVCPICQIVRPPRSSHNAQLDVCVLQSDHLCHVTATLVAINTVRFFTMFMFSVVLLCIFMLVRASVVAATTDLAAASTLKMASTWSVLACTVVFGCFTGRVGGFYVDLMARARTLKDEHGRKKFLVDNTYRCSSLLHGLCGPRVPSALYDGMEVV